MLRERKTSRMILRAEIKTVDINIDPREVPRRVKYVITVSCYT